MICLWDVDSGLAKIDKFLHSNDNHVVAGALLGVGIVNCGIRSDCDPVCCFQTSNALCNLFSPGSLPYITIIFSFCNPFLLGSCL